jgi:hypothetical protein
MAKYRWQMADGGWQKAQVVGVAISEAAFCHQAQPAIRHPPSAANCAKSTLKTVMAGPRSREVDRA